MKTDRTPMDVLTRLIDTATMKRFSCVKRDGKPAGNVGELVNGCSPEERALLSQLTSEHTLNIRPDLPEIKYNDSGKTWQEKYL